MAGSSVTGLASGLRRIRGTDQPEPQLGVALAQDRRATTFSIVETSTRSLRPCSRSAATTRSS